MTNPDRLIEVLRAIGNLYGSQSKAAMPEILAASDTCIATLKGIPVFQTTYPNKIFDYMAAGRSTVLAIDGVIRKSMSQQGAESLCRLAMQSP